jgi:predicted PurR-regulated permease PerM
MKEEIVEKYGKCTAKQKVAILTALAAFILGWGLTIAGFIMPPVGEIADSVLWVLGQALVYAASVFGITGYFTAESKRMKRDMEDYFDRRLERMNEEASQAAVQEP